MLRAWGDLWVWALPGETGVSPGSYSEAEVTNSLQASVPDFLVLRERAPIEVFSSIFSPSEAPTKRAAECSSILLEQRREESNEAGRKKTKKKWRPLGDSNPCFQDENLMSWTGLDEGVA